MPYASSGSSRNRRRRKRRRRRRRRRSDCSVIICVRATMYQNLIDHCV
jgi:hypothetical protein